MLTRKLSVLRAHEPDFVFLNFALQIMFLKRFTHFLKISKMLFAMQNGVLKFAFETHVHRLFLTCTQAPTLSLRGSGQIYTRGPKGRVSGIDVLPVVPSSSFIFPYGRYSMFAIIFQKCPYGGNLICHNSENIAYTSLEKVRYQSSTYQILTHK